jgi:hypothetical protein
MPPSLPQLPEEDRAPAALLAGPPTRLLTSVEEMQRMFWGDTLAGQATLHQLANAPFQRTPTSDRAVQRAPYGN